MKVKDLSLDKVAEQEIIEEQKEQVIETIKNYQKAIKKAELALEKLHERYEEFLNMDLDRLLAEPDLKIELLT